MIAGGRGEAGRHIVETINKKTRGLNFPCSATSVLTSAVNGEIGKVRKNVKRNPLVRAAVVDHFTSEDPCG